ncbi:DEAD/DEAH box helicase family protein [Paraburkholderia bryophila]|uniref:Type I restriction enzyme R subunit n=1 Tax=Paraburkholderia bryophila TaxID=420952 RepID=A0A7Y9WMV7_9BURK|nr:DEAD/DEAH box helicase family protein [Paraburkholderia bryophila]NYH23834.1 type I restriction enzyme R subunit [Paraburkholderia bryophila]
MGGYAEHYAHSDPEGSLVKLRSFAERLVDLLYLRLRLPKAPNSKFSDLLANGSFEVVVDRDARDKLHLLRKLGNKAAHGESVNSADSARGVYEAWQLARWFHVAFLGGKIADFQDYKAAPPEGIDNKAELKRKVKDLAERNANVEARLKQSLEELEQLRAADAAHAKLERLVTLPTEAQTQTLVTQSHQVAQQLRFTEDHTRRWMIDRDLHAAGWVVPVKGRSSDQVGQEVEVQHQGTPTGLGYADYVLWDDNNKPLAVVEAKKTTIDARVGQQQAKDYADGLEKMYGQRPMIFCTNGHEIWVWDDEQGYPPRKIYGFYSKDTLQYRVAFQRRERKDLLCIHPDPAIANRLYQLESIKRVTERFSSSHRKALIVQATGTGKTRVAIALAKLLIEAKWVKRVLFLCDRRELRKQAKNAFNEFLKEPIYVIGMANDVSKLDARIYIGIYNGLINDLDSFDVGFFDLVIADESHRSIYNTYGDIFRYFDALQIGLTATPIEMVSRSTCQIFGCDYKLPTANYPLEDAIRERNLVPFKVMAHTTLFLREGIKASRLTDQQIAELEDQGVDPNTLEFEAAAIDDAVFNKGTNRVILRNLMDNGIRDADGQLPGKSIIFARNIKHARLLAELFDEMYPQFAGKFCQVIHSEEPRAEQLIDDFKGAENCKNDQLRIAISVDMMDTGIDVPEVLNLVFAKPVRSKVKFWQMIGRGTRLCKNLFGPGKDKVQFLIFDHWGNFDYHDVHADDVEPNNPKSLIQRRYEARLELAQLALTAHEPSVFDQLIVQIQLDAETLPDNSIAVRDAWKDVQLARDATLLHQYAPATRQTLLDRVAPLMNAVDMRGQGDALRWDLLMLKAQRHALLSPKAQNACRADIEEWLRRLPPHLNPVRAKAAALKRVTSNDFWLQPCHTDLESARLELRDIVHLAARSLYPPAPSPTVLDVRENAAEIEANWRTTKIKTVDYENYRRAAQAVLEPLFETSAVLQKIRKGEVVSDADLDQLNSLIHTHHSSVDLSTLREFYPDTALPLGLILRSIIGMDDAAVTDRFTGFAQKYHLNSDQLRFLSLLKDHIRQYGAITTDALFGPPFTRIHTEGLLGVFSNEDQLDELVQIVHTFGEPIQPPTSN